MKNSAIVASNGVPIYCAECPCASPPSPPPTPCVISPTSIPNGQTGAAYNQYITASGGNGNAISMTWQILSGTMPTGLTLAGYGSNPLHLYGTPSATGSVEILASASDGNAADNDNRVYWLTVNSPPPTPTPPPTQVVLSPASIPGGEVGAAYNQSITASGGNGGALSITWATVSGTIPAGINFSPQGSNPLTISGTPTAKGIYKFNATGTDGIPADNDTAQYVLYITPSPPPSPPPPVTTPCCASTLPSTLHISFTNCQGSYICLSGKTVPLVYDANTQIWHNAGIPCDDVGGFNDIGVYCNGSNEFWITGSTGTGTPLDEQLTGTCSPVSLSGFWSLGATGYADFTVTA